MNLNDCELSGILDESLKVLKVMYSLVIDVLNVQRATGTQMANFQFVPPTILLPSCGPLPPFYTATRRVVVNCGRLRTPFLFGPPKKTFLEL